MFKMKKAFCINCKKELKNYRSSRCRSCWNKHYKGNPKNYFKSGKKNPSWKGSKVKYVALHQWIRKNKPKPKVCEICKKKSPCDVANISGKYKRDVNDYKWLCRKCHMIKDGTLNNLKYVDLNNTEVILKNGRN